MIAAGLKLGIISIFFFHYEARRIVTVLPDNCRKFAVITLIRTSDINHRDSKIHALVEVKQGESFCSSLKKFPDNVSNVSPSFLSTKNWLLVAMQTYCSLRLSQCNKRIFKYIHACTNYISKIWIICWLFDFRKKKKAWITYTRNTILKIQTSFEYWTITSREKNKRRKRVQSRNCSKSLLRSTMGIFTCGSCVNLKENRLVEQGCWQPWARKRPRGGSSNRDTSAVHTGRVPFFGPVGRARRKDRWKR